MNDSAEAKLTLLRDRFAQSLPRRLDAIEAARKHRPSGDTTTSAAGKKAEEHLPDHPKEAAPGVDIGAASAIQTAMRINVDLASFMQMSNH